MEIYGKIWGTTSRLFCKNNVEICRITGVKGGESSTHKHCSKHSMFYVEYGSIMVSVTKDYGLIDKTILMAGQTTTLLPGEFHKFEVLEDNTICYEIYWVELDVADIERKDHGGMRA